MLPPPLYPLLFEADLKQIHPSLKGIYAFYLAYNSLVGPIFRKQLNLEFDNNIKSGGLFSRNTIFLNPNIKFEGLQSCESDACHDMLHMITQNIVERFSKTRTADDDFPNITTLSGTNKKLYSPNNQQRISVVHYKQIIETLRNKVKISIKPEWEIESLILQTKEKVKSLEEKYKRQLSKKEIIIVFSSFAEKAFKEIRKENYGNSVVFYLIAGFAGTKNTFTDFTPSYKAFFDLSQEEMERAVQGSLKKAEHNVTGAVEENMGNVLSDIFAQFIVKNVHFSVEEAMQKVKAEIVKLTNRRGLEFAPVPYTTVQQKELADSQYSKWEKYLYGVIPPLVNAYSKQIKKLNHSTLFGTVKNETL